MGVKWHRAHPARALRQTLLTNVALAGISFVTGVTAAHLLGPVGRGDLAAIQLWPGVLAVLAMLGMSDALAFYSAKEPDSLNVYLTSAVGVAMASSVVFAAAGYVILPRVLHRYPSSVVSESQLYLLLIPMYALVLLPCHVLRGTADFGWWNILRLAPAVAWLVVLLVAALRGSASPSGLANGNLIGLALIGIAVVLVLRRKVRGPFRTATAEARSLIVYGIPAAGAFLPQLLNLRLDQLVMAVFLSSRSLGLYVVAVSWSSAVNPVLLAIGMILLPKVAGAGSHEVRQQVLIRTVRIGVWIAVGTVLVVAVVTPFAFRVLFPQSFQQAVPAAIVLVFAGGLFNFNFILAEGIRGLGRPAITLYAELGGLLFTALILSLFLRPLGIMGGALSSVAGYGGVTVGLMMYLRREVPGLRGATLSWSAIQETVAACISFAKRQPRD